MPERFYMRVMTKFGNDVHLTEVESQHRLVNITGLKTLCDRVVFISMDGCSDQLSCKRCAKAELAKPLRRRARSEGGVGPPYYLLKQPPICPHPARDGRHEEYLRSNGSTFCRACGCELNPPKTGKPTGRRSPSSAGKLR